MRQFFHALTVLLYLSKVNTMAQKIIQIWQDDIARQLAEALVSISDKNTMQNFLRDVMTEKEITEISARLEAALMLTNGKKYTEITTRTKLSSRTVARISAWLRDGSNGYQAVISTLNHHDHTPPARAD